MKLLEQFRDQIFRGKRADSVVPVDLTNVADWYFREAEIGVYNPYEQFPNCASPWEMAFYEYKVPTWWKLKNPTTGKWEMSYFGRDTRVGFLIYQTKLPDSLYTSSMDEQRIVAEMLATTGGKSEAVKFRQITEAFISSSKECIKACTIINYVDDTGRIVGGPIVEGMPDHMYQLLSGEAKRTGAPHDPESVLKDFLRCYSYAVYFGLSLLSCKNTRTVDNPIPKGILKKRRKQGIECVVYKTLVIDSMQKGIAKGEHGPGNSISVALHIARGHWKDYREGGGLFGKLKGLFWWDSYARGDAAAGQVKKDYAIKTPTPTPNAT